METKVNKLENQKVEIHFELTSEEFKEYVKQASSQMGKDLHLKGFRPGKAPKEITEKHLGEKDILYSAADLAVKERYPKFILEKDIEIIGQPKVEILKLAHENPFSFKVTAEILPEIELPDYKKIVSEVKKEEVSVVEKEVDDALKWLQKSRAKFKDLDREAQKQDFIEVEYKSLQIEGGKTQKDNFFLGKGHFVPGFEKELEGMKSGEKKEFTVKFPEDYFKKEMAGKDIKFEVEIKKVQEAEFPEINDSLAKTLGNFENLEKLKESIRQGILTEKKQKEKEKKRDGFLEKIVENLKFEVPQTLVSTEKERLLKDLQEQVKTTLNISFQEYLSKIKKSEREFDENFTKESIKRVKKFLILREIGKKEKIEVSENEIEGAVNEALKNQPNIKEVQKEIDIDRLKEYYKGLLYNEKVFEKLESFNK